MRPTGKLALVLIVVAALGSSARAHAAPGDLDQSFSLDGFEPVLSPSDPQALAVQPNGAAVVAGASSVAGEIYASVARYTADGPLDRTFGADGEVLLAIGEPPRDDGISTSYLHDVEVAPNGSILVAGSISIDAEGDPNDYDWLIARLRPDGSLDPSFSDDGVLTLDIGWGGAGRLELDAAGRIIVSGGGGVARLHPDGSFDPGFAGDGVQEEARGAIAVLADGSVVVARTTSSDEVVLQRFRPDGELDGDFGIDGTTAPVDLGSLYGDGGVGSLATDSSGGTLVSAYECTGIQLGPSAGGGYCQSSLFHFDEQGALGSAFGESGRLRLLSGTSDAIFAEDAVLIAGQASPKRVLPYAAAVRRTSLQGQVDESFGTGGTAYAYDGLTGGATTDLALGPEGKVTALGVTSGNVLMRFELGPEPRDSDADGLPDDRDECDLFGSPSRRGCPRIGRSATLRYTRSRVLAFNLDAQLRPCYYGERVRLLRAGPDRNRLAARALTEYGRARFPRAIPPGRYYAVAPAHLEPGSGYCERTRTETVIVPES